MNRLDLVQDPTGVEWLITAVSLTKVALVSNTALPEMRCVPRTSFGFFFKPTGRRASPALEAYVEVQRAEVAYRHAQTQEEWVVTHETLERAWRRYRREVGV